MFKNSRIFFKPFSSNSATLVSFVFIVVLIAWSMIFPAHIGYCFDRSFAWNANTEPDLAGYRIYYKIGSASSYNGTGAVEGDSPVQIPLESLSDPENPEFILHGLSGTGTFYFVATAYDTQGNESYHSNELSFESASDSSNPSAGVQSAGDSGGGGGCFIATAASGSKIEKHIQLLRCFRDRFLMPHSIGRAFVKVYYKYSPPMAHFIASHGALRTMSRWSLIPIIGLSWMLLHLGLIPALLLMVMILSIIGIFYGKLR